MGLFDFLKRKNKVVIEESKKIHSDNQKVKRVNPNDFNTENFQISALALALWKIKENDYHQKTAINELAKMGLDNNQINIIIEKVKPFLNGSLNETFKSNLGIENSVFESQGFQEDIFVKAENWYRNNILNFELVKFNLLKEGLNIAQADIIISKLRNKVSKMVNDLQEELDSGFISEIKIKPNPEHTKGNVDKDQIDRYIGYGIYQMNRGDLDNAFELFDKAIELDNNATLAYANKGKLFSLKNDHEKALYFINKALEIEPNHAQILENKVGTLFDLLIEGKISEDEFIKNINEILKRDSENPNAIFYLVQHQLRQNQLENAFQNLIKLFKINFRDIDTLKLMLDAFGHLPVESALEQFNIFENEVNDEAKYQLKYAKGLYLKGIGKFEEAIHLFEEMNTISEFSWNFYQIAIMKNLQGKTEECLEFLKSTFDLEPGLKEDAKNFPELQNIWTNPEFIDMIK